MSDATTNERTKSTRRRRRKSTDEAPPAETATNGEGQSAAETPPNEQEQAAAVDTPEVREALAADFKSIDDLKADRSSINAQINAYRKAIYARSVPRDALQIIEKLAKMDDEQIEAIMLGVRLMQKALNIGTQMDFFADPEGQLH